MSTCFYHAKVLTAFHMALRLVSVLDDANSVYIEIGCVFLLLLNDYYAGEHQ